MRKSTVLGAVVGLLVGFYAGGFFGAHRLWAVIGPSLESQAIANLNFTIEELVWHRTGKVDRALAFMEQRLDGNVLALTRGQDRGEWPPEVRRALLTAKLYRGAFPFEDASSLAQAKLAELPDEPLDPESCSPAVRFLLATASGR